MTEIKIDAKAAGQRIDVFLAGRLPELSRSSIQKLIESGSVMAGGKAVQKNDKTKLGNTYVVCVPDPAPTEIKPQEIPLDVVFEDDDVIVVNKPRGMVVHPAPGHWDGTLVNALLFYCGDSLSGINGEIRPGIVHRIDKDTSGLVIAAKNDAAHRKLASQLRMHSILRIYEAIVFGNIKHATGTIDAPIGRHPTERKRQTVLKSGGRSAVTHYEVIARYKGYTHVRCSLETGRTHQIRVHLASIGHPLIGDLLYGRKKPEKDLSGQCLHARKLRFVHPRTARIVALETELPDYFLDVLQKIIRETGQS